MLWTRIAQVAFVAFVVIVAWKTHAIGELRKAWRNQD